MKKIACLTAALVLTAFVAQADDMTITVKKASDTTAKVCSADGKGCTAVVPIKFDDGADWDSVKDTYTVSDSTSHALMMKKDYISIGSDGTASFHSQMWMKMKKTMGM